MEVKQQRTTAIRRWLRALFVGALLGAVTWLAYRLPPPSNSDIDQTISAANALWSGLDPYREAGQRNFHYPLLYPATALVIVGPLAFLDAETARTLFAAISGLVFTLAAQSYGRGLPAALVSASFLHAVILGQWSPLLTAGAVYASLGFVWAAKPSIGLALFLAFPSRRAAVGMALLGLLSLIVAPGWVGSWLEALPKGIQIAPVLQPGGFVLLLSLLRWRRPEARLLGTLACVPHTLTLYETLPLFLIPRDKWEGYALAGLSYVAALVQVFAFPRLPGMPLEEVLVRRWPLLFVCLYLPALVMALRPRPVPQPGSGGA